MNDQGGRERRHAGIMARLQAGEKELFRVIVDDYREDLRRFAARYCGWDDARARELVQDIFVRVYERRDSYDVQRPFRPWLYTVARNVCLDGIRAKVLRRRREESLWFAGKVADAENPEKHYRRKESAERLAAAVGELTRRQREVVGLLWQGFNSREIGQILGVASSSVRHHLRYACAKLRKLYTKKRL